MKILQINSVYGIGSTGKIVENIHNNLNEKGYSSHVICGRKDPEFNLSYKDNVYSYYSLLNICSDAFLSLMLDTHGLNSKNNTKKIINKIDIIKPDIIHIHNLHGFYINYKMLFKYIEMNNIKVIWTLHDCWSFTGYCSHFEYNQCDEYKSGCNICKFRNVYPYRVLSRSVKNLNDKTIAYANVNINFVTPSKWLSEKLKESTINKKNVRVINNGIDTDKFKKISKNDLKVEDNKKIILAVSSVWNKQKGFEEYIKLAKILDDEYVIVMIGLDNKGLKIIENEKNIIGLKKTNSIDELALWYNKADFFVNLTLEDTYPTVNLEAYECGCKMLGYNTGGSSEIITCYGEVVDKYDISKIAKLIKENKIYEKINIESDSKEMVDKYIELYKEIGVLDD